MMADSVLLHCSTTQYNVLPIFNSSSRLCSTNRDQFIQQKENTCSMAEVCNNCLHMVSLPVILTAIFQVDLG